MNDIFEEVDKYIRNLVARENEVLQRIEKGMTEGHLPAINVSPVQGKFLQVLAKMCNAKKILEIGTLGGYSTAWLAGALPRNGIVITIEADDNYAGIARKNFEEAGLDKIVEVRVGKALEVLPLLEKEGLAPFDMIFIDADKPPYKDYFDWAIKLGRPGSVIVADNVIREGKVLDANNSDEKVQGVQRLNEALATDTRVTATILQTVGAKEHDGMVIAVVN